MIYGFKKMLFSKDELDKMNSCKRVALANQESRGGKAFIYDGEEKELKLTQQMSDLYYIYEDDRAKDTKDNVSKVYVVAYTAYDEEGLYTEVHTFDTLEKAIEDKDTYVLSEIADEYTTFGGICKDVCNGNAEKFLDEYAEEISERTVHLYDPASDHYINIDIFEQIVR